MNKKACFIHVFKAGGTTVSDWLMLHYPESGVPSDPIEFRKNRYKYITKNLLRGHIYYIDVKDINDRIFLTMLREPKQLYMSALWHMFLYEKQNNNKYLTTNIYYDKNVNLIPYAKKLASGALLLSAYFYEDRLPFPGKSFCIPRKIHAVGLTEHMQDSLRLFAWKLGLNAPRKFKHCRKTGAGSINMPDDIETILYDHLYWDSFIYKEAEKRFEQDFSRLCEISGGAENIDDFLDFQSSKK